MFVLVDLTYMSICALILREKSSNKHFWTFLSCLILELNEGDTILREDLSFNSVLEHLTGKHEGLG